MHPRAIGDCACCNRLAYLDRPGWRGRCRICAAQGRIPVPPILVTLLGLSLLWVFYALAVLS